MFSPFAISAAGVAVGLLYGLFGVGSAFATPILALLGVPGLAAVVGPLPALLPGSAAGAVSYTRGGNVDWRVARFTMAGALPAAIVGALASHAVNPSFLLVVSGVVLLVLGVRVLISSRSSRSSRTQRRPAARRLSHPAGIVAVAAVIGFVSGLLANGGGFLLVPLFLLLLGLDMHEAAGTSLVVAVALTIPTIATHAVLGDLAWPISLWFALGLVPSALLGARLGQRVPTAKLEPVFGLLLLVFAGWFLVRQAMSFFA